MTAEIIAKYLEFTPVVMAEVVTLGKDKAEVEMVVGMEKAGVMGGEAFQSSLTSTPALTQPRYTILNLSIGILRRQRSRRCGRTRREPITEAVI